MTSPAKSHTHPEASLLTTSTLKMGRSKLSYNSYVHDYSQNIYLHACAGDVGVRGSSSGASPKGSVVQHQDALSQSKG